MDINECRLVVASNLIRLRTGAGLTQAELGEKLNYSDKSISKWERAAALPDVFVLRQMADLFGVTVDYFLEEHGEKDPPSSGPVSDAYINHPAIIKVILAGIWALAVLAFVIVWIAANRFCWVLFGGALLVSMIVWIILNSVWCHGKGNMWLTMFLVASVLGLFYLIFMQANFWQLFFVLIPAEVAVYFGFRIRRKR